MDDEDDDDEGQPDRIDAWVDRNGELILIVLMLLMVVAVMLGVRLLNWLFAGS